MCEQTEVEYLEGDIVWVKLGPCWWPGEVQDVTKLDPELVAGLKKAPLAVIKFFQEDSFEYVKNLNNIYKYNCRKKHEFIKKGLDMYRSKNKEENNFMKKFPKDVSIAESKTGGDPNIVNNEMFAPEQKLNYSQLFGTPSPKKTPKLPGRGRPGTSGATSKTSPETPRLSRNKRIEITHPRFIGLQNDYGVTVLEQTTPPPKSSEYNCHICGYRATRLNVIMLHTKSHSNQSSPIIIPKGRKIIKSAKRPKGPKKSFSQTNNIDEDIQMIRDGNYESDGFEDLGSDEEKKKEINKPLKTPKRKRAVKAPLTKKQKIEKSSMIFSNLLADWNESDDDAEASTSKESEINKEEAIEEKMDKVEDKSKEEKAESQENGKVSCFDFKDDEEEEETVLEKSPGRKIPRVIPQKRKSLEISDSEHRPESEVETKSKGGRKKKSSEPVKDNKEIVKEDKVLEDSFQNILEETAVPEVPSLDSLKAVKNFQERQPIKSPDKGGENDDKTNGVLKKESESATDFHPKKRFVRNFEDFENFHNEQKIAEEQTDDVSKEKSTNLEVSKLKTQLMTKLTTEHKEEQTKTEEKIETITDAGESSDLEKSEEGGNETDMLLDRTLEELTDPIPELKDEMNITPLIKEMQEQVKRQMAEHKKAQEKELENNESEQIDDVPKNLKETGSDTFKNVSEPTEVVNTTSKNDTTEEKIQESLEKMEEDVVLSEPNEICKMDDFFLSSEVESPKIPENFEPVQTKEQTPHDEQSESNTVETTKTIMDIPDICINNTDNLSGLSTLAEVSNFLSTNLSKEPEKNEEDITDETKTVEETNTDKKPLEETIEDSLSEQKQEEIRLPPKKVATLASFSLDYSDSNDSIPKEMPEEEKHYQRETVSFRKIKKPEVVSQEVEEPEIETNIEETTLIDYIKPADNGASTVTELQYTFSEEDAVIQEKPNEQPHQSLESEMAKLTDTHPGSEEVIQEQMQNTTSSKLLEILTEPKPVSPNKKVVLPTKAGLQLVISGDKTVTRKFDAKMQKLVIKSTSPGKSSPETGTKPSKPIRILSEKIIKPERVIIKPDADSSESVSVKKVTSKRTFQDVEDIDTFIISKKPTTSSDNDKQDIVLTPKLETTRQIKPVGRARNKPRIIEQTIIKAADVPTVVTTPTVVEQTPTPLLDDSMFDINSMPIVLSDQILTPESLENMPVVMSEQLIPVTTTTVIQPEKQTIKRGGTLQQVKLLNKTPKTTSQIEVAPPKTTIVKNILPRTLAKNQKVYQSSTKLLKTNPAVITQPGKPGKFIILPTTTSSTTTGSKYTVGKRLAVKTTTTIAAASPTTSRTKIISSLPTEPTGNKIMIVTNNQGQQSRVLLTPAHQKMLAGKMPGTKITKTQTSQLKGNLIHPKSILTSKGTVLSPLSSLTTVKSPHVGTKIIAQSPGQTIITSEGQILTQITPQQLKSVKGGVTKIVSKAPSPRVLLPDKPELQTKGKIVMGGRTKTILIKGSQGQTVKKYSSITPEPKNVYLSGQKQLVSLTNQQLQQATTSGKQVVVTSKGQIVKTDPKSLMKTTADKILPRQIKPTTKIQKTGRAQILSNQVVKTSTSTINIPPLAPITASQKKTEVMDTKKDKMEALTTDQKHLVIQDAVGNQTTVAEGQILAIPSDQGEGQSQSYILVTVDESGNLVPVSNETLLSLDPSLAMGDMSNVTLQIDGQNLQQTDAVQPTNEQKIETVTTETPTVETAVVNTEQTTADQQIISVGGQQVILDQSATVPPDQQQIVIPDGQQMIVTTGGEQETCLDETYIVPESNETQTVACNITTGDSNQQLIITGDPESTQKFLASLSEGNTDLSSLLTGAEGPVIINTDGQQILLNTDSDNQILLMQTSTEEDINPSSMFVNQQTMKNQDILAAALADTDVFQPESGEKNVAKVKTTQSQLSPTNTLYPLNVGNVLETSLINSPIMTPLELPVNKKVKQDLDTTLMPQVSSSLDLPITITDPSISQTVSQHVMLGNELQTNLDLPISISDTISSIRSSEMNSPSFGYSLPTLEDNTELELKTSESMDSPTSIATSYTSSLTGSMSMPLLTEEPDVVSADAAVVPTEGETVQEPLEAGVLELEQIKVPEAEQITILEPKQKVSESEEITISEPQQIVVSEPPQITTIIEPEEVIPEPEQLQTMPEAEQLTVQEPEEMRGLTEHEPVDSSELLPIVSEPERVVEPEGIVEPEIISEPILGNEPTSCLSNETSPYMSIPSTSIDEMTKKITNEMEMEEEFGLGHTPDNYDSLSEPPPGMFDNTLPDDTYTTKEVHPQDIPLPPEPPLPLETPPLPIVAPPLPLGDVPLPPNPPLPLEPPPEPENPPLPPEAPLPTDIPLPPDEPVIPSTEVSEVSNSELNSPRLDIDETSCEIPIQPDIVMSDTNMSTQFNLECRKRDCDDAIDESGDVKRTKLTCD